MGREYTSAARRAAAGPLPDDDAAFVGWVGGDGDRARRALEALRGRPVPVDGAPDRARLVEALTGLLPSFSLDGVRFVGAGHLALLDLCELARHADSDSGSADGMAAMAEFFEGLLGRAEYQRFRAHCRAQGTDPEDLNAIVGDLVEELVDRPTSRPSPSAPGPSTAGPMSRVVSLSDRHVTETPMTAEQFAAWQARQTISFG